MKLTKEQAFELLEEHFSKKLFSAYVSNNDVYYDEIEVRSIHFKRDGYEISGACNGETGYKLDSLCTTEEEALEFLKSKKVEERAIADNIFFRAKEELRKENKE